MAWISHSRLYEPTTRRWYCRICDKRTPIEVNTQWEADGRPRQWDGPNRYEWFTRCGYCHHDTYPGGYSCPLCGTPAGEQDPIEMTQPVYNPYYSYEFGVTGYDWIETHRCCKCQHIYEFGNSTC